MSTRSIQPIRAVFFDFGGVLAEEGFRKGLMVIAQVNGLDPDEFFDIAADLAYETGYVIGKTDESQYWDTLREKTGIKGSDDQLRNQLLNRFVLRQWMVDIVHRTKDRVELVAVLSDQTNWLDELNDRDGFFNEFHHIFNSYHIGKGKRDPTLFTDVFNRLNIRPEEAVFIDDNEGHISRARSVGLNAIHFIGKDDLREQLAKFGLL